MNCDKMLLLALVFEQLHGCHAKKAGADSGYSGCTESQVWINSLESVHGLLLHREPSCLKALRVSQTHMVYLGQQRPCGSWTTLDAYSAKCHLSLLCGGR